MIEVQKDKEWVVLMSLTPNLNPNLVDLCRVSIESVKEKRDRGRLCKN